MLDRRYLLAGVVAALPPLATRSTPTRRRRRRREVRCRAAEQHGVARGIELGISLTCRRGFCDEESPFCAAHGEECRCLGSGGGMGAWVRVPSDAAPACDHNCRVGIGGECLETCEHPGEMRCYQRCPCEQPRV